jgi:hypothetical protein
MSGVTNPTEEYFKDGGWGHDGARWRKDNLTWGYYDHLAEQQVNLAAGAGNNILAFTVVPAGEVWVVTGVSVLNVNTSVDVDARFNTPAVNVVVYHWAAIPLATWVSSLPLNIVLKAGDNMQAWFNPCVAGDDIYAAIWGYKMKVA